MLLRAVVIWVQLLAAASAFQVAAVAIHVLGSVALWMGWLFTVADVGRSAAGTIDTYFPLFSIVATYTAAFAIGLAALTTICCGCTALHRAGMRLRDPAWVPEATEPFEEIILWVISEIIVVGITGTIVNVILVPRWVLNGSDNITGECAKTYVFVLAAIWGILLIVAIGWFVLNRIRAACTAASASYATAINIAEAELLV